MLWVYIGWMFVAMLLAVLVKAYVSSERVDLSLSLKGIAHPYFRLGLSFHREVYLDQEVEVFILGVFFVAIQLEFVQPPSEESQKLLDDMMERIKEEKNSKDGDDDDASTLPDDSRI